MHIIKIHQKIVNINNIIKKLKIQFVIILYFY